jgi:hypothetical protein
MWRGDLFSATLLAALGGFLLVGLTESLFDGPRVTTLFFLLLFVGFLLPSTAPAAGALLRGVGSVEKIYTPSRSNLCG